MTVYGQAHLRALTPEIVKSAFRKTGLWPFNQDVISKEDMAPSKETSCEGHLPAATAPEIAMLAKLMQDMSVASQVSTVVATALAEGDESDDTDAVSVTSMAVASSAVAMIGDVVGGIEVPPMSSTMSSASAESSASGHFTNYNPTAAIQSIIDEMSTGSLAHLISITNLSSDTDLPPPPPISWCHPSPHSNIQILHLQDIEGKRNTPGFERE